MAKILLVDDDQSALDVLRHGLVADGHDVIAATGGTEAQAALAGNASDVDLLITDVSMPDVDGVTLAEGALAAKPGLAVIVMSGLAGELSRAEKLKSARVRFVSKPLSLEQIRVEVRQVLGS